LVFASVGESQRLVRDVLLRDGATRRLQAPTQGHFDDNKEIFDGLPAESHDIRFHG